MVPEATAAAAAPAAEEIDEVGELVIIIIIIIIIIIVIITRHHPGNKTVLSMCFPINENSNGVVEINGKIEACNN